MIARLLRKSYWLGGVVCLVGMMSNCSPQGVCTGLISELTIDPKDSACSLHCECNNQRYFGRCIESKCFAVKRTPCTTKGQEQPCRIPKEFGEKCLDGVQVCQPDGLDGLLWGDCQPKSVFAEENTLKTCFDGLDNDCNGKVDQAETACEKFCKPGTEGSCYTGPASTASIGACSNGTRKCNANGEWSKTCENEKKPGKEVCNGKDDDCNGQIDDALVSPACPKTLGSCKTAVKICLGGTGWGECSPATYQTRFPQYEAREVSCDGIDNDCDGKIDNGLTLPDCAKTLGSCSGAKRRCGGKKGWLPCSVSDYQGVFKDYQSIETQCDGIDNDCDGKVDNDLTAPLCERQKGMCAQKRKTCDGKNGWKTCGATEYGANYQSKENKCDGLDNDCDGTADENCKCKSGDQQPCGACKKGVQICKSDATWGSCVGETTSAEVCDGKDNDCDGKTDEDLKQNCYTGPKGTQGVGLCKGGAKTCKAGKWTGCVGQVTPKKEACNSKDDDCDGKIDEELQRACYSGPEGTAGTGLCKKGNQSCAAGKWGRCSGQVIPIRERCNKKDDDCNGKVDDSACTPGAQCKNNACVPCSQPFPGKISCKNKCNCGFVCKSKCLASGSPCPLKHYICDKP